MNEDSSEGAARVRVFTLPTLDGPITLARSLDTKPPNRGFVIDDITATCGGRRVARLRIENMPRTAFRRHYRTVFNYLAQIRGYSGCLPYEDQTLHYEDLDEAQIVSLICRADRRQIPGSPDEYAGLDRQSLMSEVRRIEKAHLASEVGEEFARFERWHVDKPFVAYVESDVQRIGLATLLYAEAATWMRERSLVMRSSTLQTAPAKAAWDKFVRLRLTRRDPDGRAMLMPHAPDAMRMMIGATLKEEKGRADPADDKPKVF